MRSTIQDHYFFKRMKDLFCVAQTPLDRSNINHYKGARVPTLLRKYSATLPILSPWPGEHGR